MLIYILLAISPVFFGLLYPNWYSSKIRRKRFYILCGLAMFIVMGLRHYSLGSTDTWSYCYDMKRAIESTSWLSYYSPNYYEIGAQAFIYLLSRVFREPQWLLAITSLIYIISIFYFVDRNSDDIPLSITAYITLGLMMFHLQGMRQSIAMSICLFAYEQAKRQNLMRFVLLVLFAALFHQTAIVFFPVYYLCRIRLSTSSILGCGFCAVVVVFSADRIIGFANALFDRNYVNTVDSGGFVATAIYFIILLVALFYYRGKEQDQKTSLVFVLIVGCLCYGLRYFGTQAAERISFYFSFAQLALLPLTSKIVVKRDQRLMRCIVILLMILLFAYRLGGSEFVPYKFFWQ